MKEMFLRPLTPHQATPPVPAKTTAASSLVLIAVLDHGRLKLRRTSNNDCLHNLLLESASILIGILIHHMEIRSRFNALPSRFAKTIIITMKVIIVRIISFPSHTLFFIGFFFKGRMRSSKPRRATRRDYRSLLKYFFKDAVYFVMKSNNHENVMLSKEDGVWSTPPQNEHKLNRAFREFRNVILIFSVKESGRFQGFARLASESILDHPPVPWVLPPGLSTKPFDGVFQLDWICRNDLPFLKTMHLCNPLNEGKPVKIGRDGQEIEPGIAQELCRLFPVDDSVDLIPLLKRMKKQSAHRKKPKRTVEIHRTSQVPFGHGGEFIPHPRQEWLEENFHRDEFHPRDRILQLPSTYHRGPPPSK